MRFFFQVVSNSFTRSIGSYFIVTLMALSAMAQGGLPVVSLPHDTDRVRIRIKKDLLNIPFEYTQKRNKLKFVRKDNGRFDIIESVPFKDYIAGVVSKEMPLNWPIEALKAQAVIARSYAVARMTERRSKHFDLDADQMDQVFAWTQSTKAYLAVNSTRDVVLTFNDKIAKAFYHADCGGHTLPADVVWPGEKNTGTAKDSWCALRSGREWSYELPLVDFKQKNANGEMSVALYKNKITVFAQMTVQKIREKFGFSNIRNSPEEIIIDKDKIVFKGRGFGHGVGLCQWGSLHLARKGRGYMDILTHYYPKADIIKIESVLVKNYFTNLEFNKTINSAAAVQKKAFN